MPGATGLLGATGTKGEPFHRKAFILQELLLAEFLQNNCLGKGLSKKKRGQ